MMHGGPSPVENELPFRCTYSGLSLGFDLETEPERPLGDACTRGGYTPHPVD
jgi:hypothetical protein